MQSADVIVLGVGTCGEDVALRLLDSGWEVIGVEPNLIGGECAYWACLPSKTMIRSANLLQEARRADGLVGRVNVEADWSLLAERVRSEVTGGWDDSFAAARFEGKGGQIVRGYGRIGGPGVVEVDGMRYRARRGIVIATGSQPMIPPVPGLDTVQYWTTHDAIAVENLPRSLVILGGGAVGCELGQVFARYGVDVTLVEGRSRLLPNVEPEASAALMEALRSEGITIHCGNRVSSVAANDRYGIVASLENGRQVRADKLLVATGRTVQIDGLGLDAIGIDMPGGFVEVDERMRAADGVWAVGDVTGKGLFTHVAAYQATIAVGDILGADPAPADYSAVPRVTFTDPEVGVVGLSEAEARSQGLDIAVAVKELPMTFRGWLHGTGNSGVIKLVVDRSAGVLVGAAVVGPRAADVLGMLGLAVRTRIPVGELVNMIYAFPTFYGGIGEALGAYGRGVGRVLDPDTEPMFDD